MRTVSVTNVLLFSLVIFPETIGPDRKLQRHVSVQTTSAVSTQNGAATKCVCAMKRHAKKGFETKYHIKGPTSVEYTMFSFFFFIYPSNVFQWSDKKKKRKRSIASLVHIRYSFSTSKQN